MDPLTQDTFFNGSLQVSQSSDGYRYSLDAVLLASIVHPKSGECVIDLGAGCAIISLILAYRHPGIRRIWAVELQDTLVDLAKANVVSNHYDDRISVIKADARLLEVEKVGGPVDWVISNPPFYPAGSGRINPNDQKAMARHEINLDLDELLKAARRLLKTGGQFAAIYPSERTVDLLSRMRAMGIEPKWIRAVQSAHKDAAKLILVRGVMAGKPGLKVERPLVIYDHDGSYTSTVQNMMKP